MKPKIIYCYDAYCGWCYGFSDVIKKLWGKHKENIDFEYPEFNKVDSEFEIKKDLFFDLL